ncbi:MAG TPA: dolichyl-phosphate beta-glucosyltransferase [Pyrinomonadaceae bacterium]|nr:dolichyl-phosphate beta-glucosyltransferase [Pyrinomonadaceae bacterium]
MSFSLSIVIPAYNEAARLGETLRTVFAYLNEHAPQGEVIVVDDGSEDGTADVAEQSFAAAGSVSARAIRVKPNRGKGHAVRAGLLAARAPIALFSDADLSTPITETPKLVKPILSGQYDLTFGSRALDRSLIGVHQPWRREQGGRVFNLIVRLSTGLPFWDTQCGFKAFRMDVCRPLVEAATVDRFGFDVELIYLAYLAELSLREIPVRWDHNEGSKVSVMRDSTRMVNEVRLIRRQAREGIYDAAIAAARVGSKDRERTLHTSGAPSFEDKNEKPSELAEVFEADAGS